jgi:ubiquinone/menaquinone biosynthesis C-methylase UbiE
MKYSFYNNRKLDIFLSRFRLYFLIRIKNHLKTSHNIKKNKHKQFRNLEIGPGLQKLPSFETLNIIDGRNVDYILDLGRDLPFVDNTFDIIYTSHVLEHVPWYLQRNTFLELHRILKPYGKLEVWVPDGLKIVTTVYDYEINNINNIHLDGWYRFNEDKDVITWANGRIFTYGDGFGTLNHPNWHRTLFTPKYLEKMFLSSGFKEIRTMDSAEVRGVSHGWINLGMMGTKIS